MTLTFLNVCIIIIRLPFPSPTTIKKIFLHHKKSIPQKPPKKRKYSRLFSSLSFLFLLYLFICLYLNKKISFLTSIGRFSFKKSRENVFWWAHYYYQRIKKCILWCQKMWKFLSFFVCSSKKVSFYFVLKYFDGCHVYILIVENFSRGRFHFFM